MEKNGKSIVSCIVYCFLLAFALSACRKDDRPVVFPSPAPQPGFIHISGETRNVMVLYSAGYNSLHADLLEDIDELGEGFLPGPGRNENVVLVISHTVDRNVPSGSYYTIDNAPVLFRMYREPGTGETVRDTLMVFDADMTLTDPSFLRQSLEFVRDEFPARGYGLVFSSHAQGWVPVGYFNNNGGDSFEIFNRSIGATQHGYGQRATYEEMDIVDFAESIPMHLDYLLVDACLMGGVEFAYELKDKVDLLGVSPTEVMSEGYDYKTMGQHLVGGPVPDCEAVCRAYFEQYSLKPYSHDRNATVTLVDCRRIDALAEAVAPLFEKYRERILLTDPDRVQRYFRYGKHWFYDLEDLLVCAGMTESEKAVVDRAMDGCIIYRDHTEKFLEIQINSYCGLSTYLPSYGSPVLDSYYRTLAWNRATSFVK